MSEENKRVNPPEPEKSGDTPGQQSKENPPNPPNPTGPTGAPADPVPVKAPDGKSKRKKRAILFLVVMAVLLGLLALLNTVDFEALSQKLKDDSPNPSRQTVRNYPAEWFEKPKYDEDVTADAAYMDLNRFMEYTQGSESFLITGDPAVHGDLCVFWQAYLDALVAGDADALRTLHTDRYFDLMKEDGEFLDGFNKGFAPQKVYNFRVKLLETHNLGNEGDANGNYKGYTVHYFEVSYQIKDNNGTFRRDMDVDGNAVPLRFEVLERGDTIRINTQSRNQSIRIETEEGVNIMMYIWIALILLAIVSEVMTTALVAVWFIPSGIVSLVLSIIWPDQIVAQIITYVAVSALLLILTRPLIKRHLRKRPFQPTNADMVVGKIAIVTEAIDNVAQTGEVRVAGKRWSARSADGNPIAVDTLVSVLEIQGVKLICAPAPKGAKFE